MKQKNKSIVFYGNINDVCDYLKKCAKDFLYLKDLIEYYDQKNNLTAFQKESHPSSLGVQL